jgi:hypothetical protein
MEAGPRKTFERLASLFDLLDEGMALCELVYEEGACVDYLVVDANAQYAIHTGLPQTEVIGRRASTLFGSAEAPRASPGFWCWWPTTKRPCSPWRGPS